MTLRQSCLSVLAFTIAGGWLSAQSPEALKARQEMLDLRPSLGLDGEHDFQIRSSHKDQFLRTHTLLQQYFQGVKVWGGEVITHTDTHGRKLPLSGELTGTIQLFARPVLTAKEALAVADADLAPKGPYAYEPKVELVVYPVLSEVVKPERAHIAENKRSATDYKRQLVKHVLAYHVHTQLENGTEETLHTDFMVDAHTGAVIQKWDSLQTSAATGSGNSQYSGTVALNTNLNGSSYELSDVVGNMPIKTYNLNHGTGSGTGTLYTDADNTWGDGANYVSGGSTTSANGQTAAVDAHYGIMMTSGFYKNVFSRNGIDGANKATYSRVHYSSSYDNAFWDDSCFCMTYGDGSSFKSLEALDVAGHEMSHGVCASTANLTYSGEPGGLNESNSDIFGTFVTFYAYGAGGTGTAVPASIPTTSLHGYTPWTIGSQLSSTPLRWMYKPSKDGYSPDAWSSTLKNLDVHYSSGPMNRCMYFLSQGAGTSGDTYTSYLPSGMTGIGNNEAARIWYRALTTYMTSSTNYAAARTACISAAQDLYGAGSAEEQAVWNAFHGINVGSAWSNTLSVSISPTTATVQPSATYQFTASVSGSTNTAVTWSVTEAGGGTVSSTGLYTAPATTGTYHVKATSQGDSTVSATATVTVSTSTTTELIKNGGFESGATSWSGTTGDIGAWSGEAPYAGSYCAWILGNGSTATETLYQSVAIPSTATTATLSFYLHIDTAETTTTTAYDKLVVSLQNSSGTTLKTLATYSNLNKASGYTLRTFDVSAYKGQTVRVYFKGTEDSSLQTSFVVDNVSLQVK